MGKEQPVTASTELQDNEALRRELDELKATNQHLKELLEAAERSAITISGYLNKYRSTSGGLLSNDWERRFFALHDSTLKYFKSDRDLLFLPLGEIDVKGCVVEWEGLKGKFWTFGLVDATGHSLARMSTDSRSEADRWIEALGTAGGVRRTLSNLARTRSPLPAADMPRVGSSGLRSRPASQDSIPEGIPIPSLSKFQDRWEESSTDGEADPRRTVHSRTARLRPETISHAGQPVAPTEPLEVGPAAPHHKGPMFGSSPVHSSSKYSVLSSERISFQKHAGLLNLCVVILFTTNFRLILENLLKYGLRFNPVRYVRRALQGQGNLPLVLCFPALLAASAVALCVEQLAHAWLQEEYQLKAALAKKEVGLPKAAKQVARAAARTEAIILALNAINTTAVVAMPCVVIGMTKAEPIPGLILTMCVVVVWMKLVSFAHCNYDLRCARREGTVRVGERGSADSLEFDMLRYPENLSLANLFYFIAAPTLTYQVNFPRSSRVRLRWLLRRVLELLVYLGLLLFIVEQYIEPTIANSLAPMRNMDTIRVVERVLKLAIPSMYAWLAMFYVFFHLLLNITAELLRFGDREFYKTWWNAATIGEYWKLWNMPVHKWLLRTVYFPALRAGVPRLWSVVLVFFVSAIFHELVIGVPLHMVRWWAFTGIMAQVPLTLLTENLRKKLNNDTLGNIAFWISFCVVGQPIIMLMYYHDYVYDHRTGANTTASVPPPAMPAAITT